MDICVNCNSQYVIGTDSDLCEECEETLMRDYLAYDEGDYETLDSEIEIIDEDNQDKEITKLELAEQLGLSLEELDKLSKENT